MEEEAITPEDSITEVTPEVEVVAEEEVLSEVESSLEEEDRLAVVNIYNHDGYVLRKSMQHTFKTGSTAAYEYVTDHPGLIIVVVVFSLNFLQYS